MTVYKLQKSALPKFLESLKKGSQVFAPVKRDVIRFEPLGNPADVDLSANSYFPLKEYFFPPKEVLFHFSKKGVSAPVKRAEKRIFFGVRRCDLAAIQRQDLVFIKQQKDPYYAKRRENSLLIGYHCNTPPSSYCFCGSMGLEDFYDLMFFDRGSHFLVHAKTAAGQSLAKNKFFNKTPRKITDKERRIRTRALKKDISQLYNNKGWKPLAKRCLSCAACTELCPTCYCYEIRDEPSIEGPYKGKRCRSWSSCQLKDFTRVAEGHVFREKREERFKHRIYHQIQYFKERNKINLCTGCGRCVAGCPARIDWVKAVNRMKK
ncbi:MAG: 4Fe-4S dicluster domain-containing protein [Candidatus Aenigmarchaeota archaeon]|nr:4Fe-4S dicluster domain-containing protein [Candidatus Aenigmarchaeota archaeon]